MKGGTADVISVNSDVTGGLAGCQWFSVNVVDSERPGLGGSSGILLGRFIRPGLLTK